MSNWGANDPVIDQPAQSSWGQSDPEVPVELARKHEEQAQMLTHARNRLSGKTKNVASDALLGGTLGVASLIPGVRENALATAVGLGTSVAAPAARNWYQEDLADKLNRFGDAYEQAASERDQKGVIPPILKRAVRGAGKTLPTSIVAGHLAGPYGAIGVTALQERDKAITEGRDMGMSEPQVQRYAAVQGVVEALPAAVFQKIGLGGFESAITRQTASRSVLPAVKQALKDSFQELPEENITELGHSVTRAVMAGDWKAISPKELWNTIKETTVQTLVTMGMVEAPNVAQAGVAGAARAQRLAQLKELRGVNGSILKREAEKAGINTEGLSRQDVRGQIELEIKREQEIQNEVPPEATQPEEVRQADVGQGQVPAVEVPVGGTTGAPQGNQQAGAEGIPQVPIDEDIMAKILADAEEAGQKASKRQSFADLNSPNPLPETDLQQQATPKGGDVLVQGPTDITIPSAKPKIKGKKPVPTPPESLPTAPQPIPASEPTLKLRGRRDQSDAMVGQIGDMVETMTGSGAYTPAEHSSIMSAWKRLRTMAGEMGSSEQGILEAPPKGYGPGAIRKDMQTIKDLHGELQKRLSPEPTKPVPVTPVASREAEKVVKRPVRNPTELTDEQLGKMIPDQEGQAKYEAEMRGQTYKSPDVKLAGEVSTALAAGETIDPKRLHSMAEGAYGGTRAEGAYDPSRANDAMELGINLHAAQAKGYHPANSNAEQAKQTVKTLEDVVQRTPSHTNRSGLKDVAQQFSTPPAYAYAVNWIANIGKGDTVLEPSAGTGSIAVHAKETGANVYVNELKEVGGEPNRRAELLNEIGAKQVFTEDAEQIHNTLKIKPTVVVMNPPFSTAAGRMEGKKIVGTDLKHIDAALKLMQPGGRLVAIIGAGLHGKSKTLQDWQDNLKHDLRADIELNRDVYKGYGTTFPTRVLVIDKTTPTGKTLHGKAETLYDLIDQLEGIRNDRTSTTQSEATRTEGEGTARPSGAKPRPESAVRSPVSPVVSGGKEAVDSGGTGTEARTPAGRPGKPVDQPTAEGRAEAVPESRLPDTGHPESGGKSTASRQPEVGGTTGAEVGGEPVREPSKPESRPEPSARVDVVTLESAPQKPRKNELSESVYESYHPRRVTVAGSKPHPASVVESAAMAAVDPPKADYSPNLPSKAIESGALSNIQLEAIIYAGHAHGQEIEIEGKKYRKGFLIGDGTGIGKGRTAAGVILDNYRQGRKKAVWVSKNYGLMADSKEYSDAVGLPGEKLFSHQKTASGTPFEAKDGILFTTYETMRGTPSAKALAEGKQKSRLDQVVDWLGEDFDGVIVFDEAHLMGNAVDTKGGRGVKKASARALAGVELQRRLPQARIVYMSATAATEVSNLAYAERLGLWGKGTAFANQNEFETEITKGGVAAMEKVAGDMKAMGLYVSRNISFNDGTKKGTVEYERLEHTLTPSEKASYDKMAEGWAIAFRDMNAALAITDGAKNGQAVSAARSAFWGANQRFWNQVITAMQTPAVIRSIEKDLADGHSAVVQLTNTNEAATQRALSELDEDEGYEEIDTSPRGILMDFVEKSFPVWQFEEYTDDNGNVRMRPVLDSAGNKVKSAEAVRLQEQLLDELGSLQVGSRGAIDMIVDHFGADQVAEITGRSMRLVKNKDGKLEKESRSKAKNSADIKSFQEGAKHVLIFSEAGGTGASYHADLNRKNQEMRRHYLLQAGWRADVAIQGFGRSHRSNQAQAPSYILVHTNLKGQKRFISTIARRLAQLGAITKGQRQAVSGGEKALFTAADNLESTEAKQAILRFYNDVLAGSVPSVTMADMQDRLGLKLTDENGNMRNDLPPITQFLNRVLSMPVDEQNNIFSEFEKRLTEQVEMAQARGELDQGIETIRADKITKQEDRPVYKHQSGAETRYVKVQISRKTKPTTWALLQHSINADTFYARSVKTGKVMAVIPTGTSEIDTKSGDLVHKAKVLDPLGYRYGYVEKLQNEKSYDQLSAATAKTGWDEQVKAAPEFHETDGHFLTGVLLPIWNRIPGENSRVMRMLTDEGEVILGRQIPEDQVQKTLKALGVSTEAPQITPTEAAQQVMQKNVELTLANDWKVQRRLVANEQRIELVGPSFQHHGELAAAGVFWERIQGKTRYFIPVDRAGEVLKEVLEGRPITDVVGRSALQQSADKALQEAKDELNSFTKLVSGNRPNAGVSPETIASAARVVLKFAHAGFKQFQVMLEHLDASIGQAARDQIHSLLEAAWDKAQASGRFPGMEPRVKPETNPAGEENLTSIKNEVVNELREKRGIEPLPEVAAQTREEWMDVAAQRIAESNGTIGPSLVAEIHKQARNLSNIEVAILQTYYRGVNNAFESASEELFDAVEGKDPAAAAIAQTKANNLLAELDNIELATKAAGREWGQAGVARQIMLAKDFSIAAMTRKARVANGGQPLNAKQTAEIAELAKRVQELEKQLAEQSAKTADLERDRRAQESVDKDVQEVKKAKVFRKSVRRQKAEAKVAAAWKEFNSLAAGKLYSTPAELVIPAAKIVKAYVELGVVSFSEFMANARKNLGAEQADKAQETFQEAWDDLKAKGEIPTVELDQTDTAGISRLARQIQRSLVELGITKRDEVVDAVHESLMEFWPDITRRETMDALSGYGQFSPLTSDEISRIIRDINGQLQQLGKLDDMQQGEAPAKTGHERRTPSDEERRLIQQVNEAKKRGGFNVVDPDRQLKTALDAAKTATRNRIADLEHEIRTKELIVRKKTDLKADAELESLRKQRDALREVHKELFPPKEATEEQKIAAASRALDRAIEQLEADIAAGDVEPHARPTPLSSPELDSKRARLEALREQRDALRDPSRLYKADLLKRIADYRQRMENGEFLDNPKKEARVLTREELDLKRQLEDVKQEFFERVADYRIAQLSPIQKVWHYTKETAHLSRALMTSFDLSAVFRQGGIGAFSHPGLALKAGKKMLQAFGSRQAEFDSVEEIRNRPNAQLYETAGLSITEEDGKMTRQEEAFMGRWGRKIAPVRASSRAYMTFLNNLRADMFDLMVENLGRSGAVTLDEAKVIATYVNVATGRADFGKFNTAMANLNTVFFAPRFVASRFQFLAPFYALKGTGRVQKAIAMEYGRYAAGVGTFMGLSVLLGALLAGDDDEWPTISFDPTSADFLKIKMGETRIDPLSGLSQVVVFLSRLGKKGIEAAQGKDEKYGENSAVDIIGRFLWSKLAPIPGSAVNLVEGKNVVGERVTPVGAVTEAFIPLSFRDVLKTMTANGIPLGTSIELLNILGMGTATYGPRTEYLTGTEEERQAQVEKDLKGIDWNDKLPSYAEFLTDDQREQFQDRIRQKQGGVIFNATYAGKNEDELATRDKNREFLKEMKDDGVTLDEMRSLLREYYLRPDSSGKRGSLREKDSGDLKESYLKKQRALGRLFGEQ